jgi:hypothetical protein
LISGLLFSQQVVQKWNGTDESKKQELALKVLDPGSEYHDRVKIGVNFQNSMRVREQTTDAPSTGEAEAARIAQSKLDVVVNETVTTQNRLAAAESELAKTESELAKAEAELARERPELAALQGYDERLEKYYQNNHDVTKAFSSWISTGEAEERSKKSRDFRQISNLLDRLPKVISGKSKFRMYKE